MKHKNKQDKLYCATCRTRLLEEMLRPGDTVPYSGVVGMHCVKCNSTTPIWPRRIQAVPQMKIPEPGNLDVCVMCSTAILTVFRRGKGERAMFCNAHSEDDKARWRAERAGKCLTPQCERVVKVRGRCNACYQVWYRAIAQANRVANRALRLLPDSDN